jgi:MFS family permease
MQASIDATFDAQGGDSYARRRRLLSCFFFVMCLFRDSIFISGPIFVFRLEGSLESGGLYGSSLLFGGLLSFLIMGVFIDRVGWKRVALGAAATLALAELSLACTVLGLLPYQRELDLLLLTVVFFAGSCFYLVPDVLINGLLREADRPAAYSRSGSLFPAASLIASAGALYWLDRLFGGDGLGLLLGLAGLVAALCVPLILRLESAPAVAMAPERLRSKPSLRGVVGECLSGFRFIARVPALCGLLAFNCCVGLALAPHNVFITAILKTSFGLDDAGVAAAQLTLSLVEMLTALAFPAFARSHSLRTLGAIAIGSLTVGNALATTSLYWQAQDHASPRLLLLYVAAHVVVFVGLTFATAWMRIIRGKNTPVELMGRTAGAMSEVAQLSALAFSVLVTVCGSSVPAYYFYFSCVALSAFLGAPLALSVARRSTVPTPRFSKE